MPGVTETGFTRSTQTELLDALKAEQRATIDPNLALSTESVVGQVDGIVSRAHALLWELLEALYGTIDPDRAEGDALESLAKLSGTARRAATKSTVTLRVNLDSGVTLEAGTHFASVDGNASVRFTPREDVVAAAAGPAANYDAVFEAEVTGAVEAVAGTITVVATPVSGWNSVTNALDAEPGEPVESDELLRSRREVELARAGTGTVRAIRADVSAVDGVEAVLVLENVTDAVSDGLAPHSFEVIVSGDTGATVDQAIGEAVWANKPAGILAGGSTAVTVVDDVGVDQTVRFTRATEIPVYLVFTFVAGTGYVGDTVAKQMVVDRLNGYLDGDSTNTAGSNFDGPMFTVGADVVASRVRAIPFQLDLNIDDFTAFALGVAPAPTLEVNIPIASREKATFAVSNVSVTHT